MKSRLPVAAFVTCIAIAARAGAAEPPAFSKLPAGTMPAAPAKTPSWISPKESAPGFVVGRHPGQGNAAFVVPDAKSARAMRDGGERTSSTCYSTDVDDAGWSASMSPEAVVWKKTADDPSGGVKPIHSERLVETEGGAVLEIVDAFVDPETRGARAFAKTKLPLALVGSSIGGVRVFAARDEQKDGGKGVVFVVTRPQHPALMGGIMGVRADGSSIHASGCGHLRVSMTAPVKSSGDNVVVVASAILPDLARRSDDDKAPRELRMRDVRVQLGISKTSRDAEPVLSVSFGWEGREQSVADPAAPPSLL